MARCRAICRVRFGNDLPFDEAGVVASFIRAFIFPFLFGSRDLLDVVDRRPAPPPVHGFNIASSFRFSEFRPHLLSMLTPLMFCLLQAQSQLPVSPFPLWRRSAATLAPSPCFLYFCLFNMTSIGTWSLCNRFHHIDKCSLLQSLFCWRERCETDEYCPRRCAVRACDSQLPFNSNSKGFAQPAAVGGSFASVHACMHACTKIRS